ncbi:hypothetical protein MTR_5g080295 [Medicago truncatula]|uniref:Uncharacterized protein n=1 Tax=Medicago truncatula TaxID=3880 RepID=A0A072UER4_MEDTR|nr:hypothetical protein MTR_5g080295 [Medicago truncatula]
MSYTEKSPQHGILKLGAYITRWTLRVEHLPPLDSSILNANVPFLRNRFIGRIWPLLFSKIPRCFSTRSPV